MPLPFVDLGPASPVYDPPHRWPMDEAVGNFRDLGGRGGKQAGVVVGTLARNPGAAPGWLPGSVGFTGSGYVNIWSRHLRNMFTGAGVTITAWVMRTGPIATNDAFQVVACCGPWHWTLMVGHHSTIPGSLPNRPSFAFNNVNGNWECVTDTWGDGEMPLNEWRFLMGSWDGYRLGIDRNGRDISSNSGAPAMKQDPPSATLGTYIDGTSYRANALRVADVRIWPYRLYESEGLALYNSYFTTPARPWIRSGEPGSLILHLPMEQPAGRNVRDAQGNAVGGGMAGSSGPYATNEPRPGMSYWFFNGSSDYWAIHGTDDLNNITNVWTLAAWVYPTAYRTTFTGVVTKNHTQGGNCLPSLGYAHESLGALNRFSGSVWNGSAWVGAIEPTDFALNTWAHYAATYDGATMRLYKNGALVTSVAGVSAPAATANDWLVAKRWDGAGYFPGRLSDVRIYNQTLTPESIKAIVDRASAVQRPWVPLGVVT